MVTRPFLRTDTIVVPCQSGKSAMGKIALSLLSSELIVM
jgi:hypothetical protein